MLKRIVQSDKDLEILRKEMDQKQIDLEEVTYTLNGVTMEK